MKILKGHTSSIIHMDWSVDGSYLQSNCQAYEISFWDINPDGMQQRPDGASMLRDEKWSNWTCTIGFPVQGIWRSGEDGTDINAVDRSHS